MKRETIDNYRATWHRFLHKLGSPNPLLAILLVSIHGAGLFMGVFSFPLLCTTTYEEEAVGMTG